MAKYYGNVSRRSVKNRLERISEEIIVNGYSTVEGVVGPAYLKELRKKIDLIYQTQEEMFGRDTLNKINEADICRCPLFYDPKTFIKLASNQTITSVMEHLLGNYFILNLQNAIVTRPDIDQHQGAWHRDLPYQNFTISSPISLNALIAIDPFSNKNGATELIPYTHRNVQVPSEQYIERNRLVVEAPPGAILFFDSMLLHRAGKNRSGKIRRSINHQYTIPIIKQQYDIGAFAQKLQLGIKLKQLLGATSITPHDDVAWRYKRLEKYGIEFSRKENVDK